MQGQPLPSTSNNSTCVVKFFFHQPFQSTKAPVFAIKHLSNRFPPYFLFSGKDMIKYLSLFFSVIPIIDI